MGAVRAAISLLGYLISVLNCNLTPPAPKKREKNTVLETNWEMFSDQKPEL